MPKYINSNEYLQVHISSNQTAAGEPVPFDTGVYGGAVTIDKSCNYISLNETNGRFFMYQKGLYQISFTIFCYQNNSGTVDYIKIIDSNGITINGGSNWYLVQNQASPLTYTILKNFDAGDYFYIRLRANNYITTGTLTILSNSLLWIKKIA